MGRSAPTLLIVFLLLVQGVLALVPLAGACGESLCVTDEESRRGGDCGPEDGQPADYYRYVNASVGVGDVAVRSSSTFACENQQPRPWVSGHYEKMWTNVTVESPGRVDQVKALYTYGALHNGCSAWAGVFLDRVLIFSNPSVGQGVSSPCGGTNAVPSVAEALP